MNKMPLNVELWALPVLLAFLIAGVDLVTGYQLSFFVFYFIPVALAAWYLGLAGAISLAVGCAILWFGAFVLSDSPFTSFFYVIWNTAIRLVAYPAIGWSVSMLKHSLNTEKEKNRRLQAAINERTVFEEELRESRLRLERSQQIAHLGSWEFDTVKGKLTWSDEVYRIFGLQPQVCSATYEAFLERVHPDDRAAVDAAYTGSVNETRDAYEIEHRVVCGNGEIRMVHEKCEHFRDAAGRIVRSAGTVHDITDYKRAEEALRESEQKFRSLFDNSQAAVLLAAPDGSLQSANPTALAMFGWSEQEICDIRCSEVMDTNDSRFPAALDERQRTGRIRARELTAIRKSGEKFPVEVDAVTLPSQQAFVILRDISERKKAEEELRIAYGRLKSLFDHRIGGIGIAISNAKGDVIQANDHLLNILGFTRQELISGTADWRALSPPEWLPVDEFALQQIKEQGTYHPVEKEFFRRDGSRVPVLITGVTMPGDSGEILSYVLDITERKRYEASLHQLNRTLEQRVAERTELAESRAKQLQKLAIELMEAEERERARMAELLHDDLQQTLAAARLRLDMVIDSSSAHPMLEIVAQLLKESIKKTRLLSHELSPPMPPYSELTEALKWLAELMKTQFGLTVEVKAAQAHIISAPFRSFIFRAVKELLFNIIKHAGVKSARVRLSCSGTDLMVKVSDKGKGFDSDVLAPTAAVNGLGLLSIRERVRYIGGSLEIKSVRGKGSRFILKIPLSATEPAQAIDTVSDRPVSIVDAPREGIQVLFADDHKVLRQGLIQLIAKQPDIHVVGEAANGREALELSRQLRPDVIVMDVSMPEMDGIEATRLIKTELPSVHVIGLSMHDDEEIARTMRQVGAEAFVSKTVSSSELLKAIYKMGSREQAAMLPPSGDNTDTKPTQLTFSWPL